MVVSTTVLSDLPAGEQERVGCVDVTKESTSCQTQQPIANQSLGQQSLELIQCPKLTRIAKVEHEMGQYAELKTKLSSIMVREEEGPLEMLTDLGADCFAKVKVRRAVGVGVTIGGLGLT